MKLVKLGNLASIQTGKIDVNNAVVDGKYPFFTCSRDAYKINDAPFEGKAVLVAGNGDLNVKYYEGRFNAYQRTYFLFVNDENELIPRYLYWFLESYVGQLRSESIGSTIKYIKMGNLTDAEIPLPSLEKQREIVEKLDSAFAEIEAMQSETDRFLANLSNLLDSKLDEAFTTLEEKYGMVQSGTVIDIRDGTHDSPSYVDSGCPLITSKNLQKGLIDFSNISFIKDEDYEAINRRSKVDSGDLLFAMIGTIGNPVVVKETPNFAIKNVALFKCNPAYDMTFLSYFLRTPKIKEKFEREAKGTTQRFLGLGYLRTLDIPNVRIEDQIELVNELSRLESEKKSLELNVNRKLELIRNLNNSILSSAFAAGIEREVA